MWFFSQEQKFLQNTVRQFAKKELAPHVMFNDQTQSFQREAFFTLGKLGLLGLSVSEKDGGSSQGAISLLIVLEEIAFIDPSFALSYLAHTLLCVHQIGKNGSESQKKDYLPKLLSGEWIGCMSMSEPDAGSDIFNMTSYAKLESNFYRIQGKKAWITNGPEADVFYCYLKTTCDKKSISPFILLRNTPGLTLGKKIDKMGMRGSPTGELFLDNCLIPAHQKVGTEETSLPKMMQNLALERLIISGISLGIAHRALEKTISYSQERKAFGKKIGSYQQIQEKISLASSHYESARSFAYQVAYEWDHSLWSMEQLNCRAAQVKLLCAPMATHICLDAIQILGGYGYTKEFEVERMMRDAKLIEIGAGTNQILCLIIARFLLQNQHSE